MVRKLTLFLSSALLFCSCDAFVSLSYSIENKTSRPLKVFVPGYQKSNHGFSKGVDTTLEIAPHSSEWLGTTLPRVTGPIGATRRIYRTAPGFCGLRLISADTTIALGCTRKEWKFRRGISVMKIRH